MHVGTIIKIAFDCVLSHPDIVCVTTIENVPALNSVVEEILKFPELSATPVPITVIPFANRLINASASAPLPITVTIAGQCAAALNNIGGGGMGAQRTNAKSYSNMAARAKSAMLPNDVGIRPGIFGDNVLPGINDGSRFPAVAMSNDDHPNAINIIFIQFTLY